MLATQHPLPLMHHVPVAAEPARAWPLEDAAADSEDSEWEYDDDAEEVLDTLDEETGLPQVSVPLVPRALVARTAALDAASALSDQQRIARYHRRALLACHVYGVEGMLVDVAQAVPSASGASSSSGTSSPGSSSHAVWRRRGPAVVFMKDVPGQTADAPVRSIFHLVALTGRRECLVSLEITEFWDRSLLRGPNEVCFATLGQSGMPVPQGAYETTDLAHLYPDRGVAGPVQRLDARQLGWVSVKEPTNRIFRLSFLSADEHKAFGASVMRVVRAVAKRQWDARRASYAGGLYATDMVFVNKLASGGLRYQVDHGPFGVQHNTQCTYCHAVFPEWQSAATDTHYIHRQHPQARAVQCAHVFDRPAPRPLPAASPTEPDSPNLQALSNMRLNTSAKEAPVKTSSLRVQTFAKDIYESDDEENENDFDYNKEMTPRHRRITLANTHRFTKQIEATLAARYHYIDPSLGPEASQLCYFLCNLDRWYAGTPDEDDANVTSMSEDGYWVNEGAVIVFLLLGQPIRLLAFYLYGTYSTAINLAVPLFWGPMWRPTERGFMFNTCGVNSVLEAKNKVEILPLEAYTRRVEDRHLEYKRIQPEMVAVREPGSSVVALSFLTPEHRQQFSDAMRQMADNVQLQHETARFASFEALDGGAIRYHVNEATALASHGFAYVAATDREPEHAVCTLCRVVITDLVSPEQLPQQHRQLARARGVVCPFAA